MKRINLIGTLIAMTMILGIAGCQMFDESPTEVNSPNEGVNNNFLMGAPELEDWGAYYEAGGSFVRLDIPVDGAIKIEYSSSSGWTGAIFGSADSPIGVEIGVKDGDTIDSACVSYVEDGSFSAMPSNVEKTTNGDWTQYLYVNDDGSTRDWWPASADFTFSGETTTTCGIVASEVQWDEIPGGAFDKAVIEAAEAAEAATCPGLPANNCGALGYTLLRCHYIDPAIIYNQTWDGAAWTETTAGNSDTFYNIGLTNSSGAAVDMCIDMVGDAFFQFEFTSTPSTSSVSQDRECVCIWNR